LLFLGSKPNHAALAFVVAGFFAFARLRRPCQWQCHEARGEPGKHVLTAICVVAMLAVPAWVVMGMPNSYKAQPRFTLVFSKVLTASATPIADVRELGLSESDLSLIGQHAFLPYSPAFDPVWLEAFSRRCTYAKVARFWLRHPLRTLAALKRDLYNEAWRRRPVELSNFQPRAGEPPGEPTARRRRSSGTFDLWSALAERISHAWPMAAVLWYAMVPVFESTRAFSEESDKFRRALVRVALLSVTLGLGEFLIASLADARETDRHLLLFHLFTDASIFFALVYFIAGQGVQTDKSAKK
jgi:hypothetical protein